MIIKFKSLKFKNILSYSNKLTTFEFQNGLNLISGKNGAGKSSLINVLTFCLFGQPYSKINIPHLINRQNRKDLFTQCEFSVGNDNYVLIRTIKPDSLSIEKNGQSLEKLSSKLLTQDEIDKILGIDYKLFKNVVSLAVSYNKPFLTLSAQEKREVVESIFNIKIFSEMLKIVKKRISLTKIDVDMLKVKISSLESELKLQKSLVEESKRSIQQFETSKKNELDILSKQLKEKEDEIENLKKKIEQLKEDIRVEKENVQFEIKRKKFEIDDLSAKLAKKKIEIEADFTFKIEQLSKDIKIDASVDYDKELELFNNLENDRRGREQQLISRKIPLSTQNSLYQEEIEKWKNKGNRCVECDAEISSSKKTNRVKDFEKKIEANIELEKSINLEIDKLKFETVEVAAQIKKAKENIQKKSEYLKKQQQYENEKSKSIQQIEHETEMEQSKIKYQLSQYEQMKFDKVVQLEEDEEKIKILYSKLKEIQEKIKEIESRECKINIEKLEIEFKEKCELYKQTYQNYQKNCEFYENNVKLSEILSDKGIKSYFFNKLIPVLNDKINQYLNKFNLPIIIQFDECLAEKINSYSGRDQNISYYSFSGGERTRIDISILMSFVDIMKSITNFSCNILFFDELLDSQMDNDGLDRFIESMRVFVDNNKNLGIYIISHKLQNSDLIDRKIKITKHGPFSEIGVEE